MSADDNNRTMGLTFTGPMIAAVDSFENAWKASLAGGLRPVIDDYLGGFSDGDRIALRAELTRIDREYEQQLAGQTVGPASATKDTGRHTVPSGPGETVVHPVAHAETDAEFSLDPAAVPPGRGQTLAAQVGPGGTIQYDNAVDRNNLTGAFDLKADDPDFQETIGFTPAPKPNKKRGGPAAPPPAVTGYEILGELGRGGMGVVYKARQIKLDRLVALKMVLAGAHAGTEQLDRFLTEAQAVGQLKHVNIVQIYEVGEHDGLPYFSLEFVGGGNLAELLARKPMTPEDAATIVRVLAVAMADAHSRNIIHRDLKPANVLITEDGVPKITDFGLAKRLESDSGQTRSGTLMGTPNYMAPEQARGDTHAIGPLADVYALGVILYECITGRTPFVGASVVDTLQQVQNHEPVPPSRLQPKVPADLETICLKCLQKEPHKRYESAKELADDLGRFLAGESILARPIGLAERAWRWCKRNPAVAGLLSAVFLLLVTGTVVSTAMAWRISKEHTAAVAARELAVENAEKERVARERADQNAEEARQAKALADQKAKDEQIAREQADKSAEEARQARTRADANAKVASDQAALALETLQILVDKVQKQLDDAPRTQKLKREILQSAMDGLKKVAGHAEKSTSTEATMALAHMRMGHMFRQLGDTEAAFRQFELCHAITQKRAEAMPDRDASQSNLAATFTVLGDMSQELRRDMRAALDYYRKALAIRHRLYASPKGGEGKVDPLVAKQNLAEAYTRVAVVILRLGDPAGAIPDFEQALALREELTRDFPANEAMRQDLARTYNALGEVYFRVNDRAKALDYSGHCLDERERLLKAKPDSLRFKRELAAAAGNTGDLQLYCGHPDLARPLYDRSLALSRELALADPENVDYQRELGLAYYRLGVLAGVVGNPAAAADNFKECLAIRERLAKDAGNERRQAELMLVLARIGDHARAATIADTIRGTAASDPEVLSDIARCLAGCVAAANDPELADVYRKKAIRAIGDAIGAGYRDWVALETEPDLKPVRDLPEFKALVARLKAE